MTGHGESYKSHSSSDVGKHGTAGVCGKAQHLCRVLQGTMSCSRLMEQKAVRA